MCPWCSAGGLLFFKFTSLYSFWFLSLQRINLLLMHLAKAWCPALYWGCFSSPGLITHKGSDLKLQWQSWRYDNASLAITLAGEFSYCGQTAAPGCCTCRRRLLLTRESHFRWFYEQIFILTLAGESSNCLQLLIEASSNKKWQIITFLY